MTAPIYIPTNSVGGFPFLHTLSRIYCLWIFCWWPFWQVWGDITSNDLHFSIALVLCKTWMGLLFFNLSVEIIGRSILVRSLWHSEWRKVSWEGGRHFQRAVESLLHPTPAARWADLFCPGENRLLRISSSYWRSFSEPNICQSQRQESEQSQSSVPADCQGWKQRKEDSCPHPEGH